MLYEPQCAMGLCVSITNCKRLFGMKRNVLSLRLFVILLLSDYYTVGQQISGGYNHSLFVCNDLSVRSCGYNVNGALGDGTNLNRYIAAPIYSLNNVISAYAGGAHSLFLKKDSTVWACGANYYGQLGDGTTINRNIPARINSLTGIIAISAGYYHSLFLKSDGTVWGCGHNQRGQLGDGTTTNRLTPVQLLNISNVTAMAGGAYFTLLLKSDGTVWACGYNANGQLGDGTTTDRLTVVQVNTVMGIKAIAAGENYSIFLRSDSTVWGCGANASQQIGNGVAVQLNTPGISTTLSRIVALSAGERCSIYLKNDGTAWGSGSNFGGQLGNGSGQEIMTPVRVTSLTNIVTIESGYHYTFLKKSNGTVWACGANTIGQLGNGTADSIAHNAPTQVLNLCYIYQPDVHYDHYIGGNLYNDSTNDCSIQTNETGLPFFAVVANPGNLYGSSDSSGQYLLGLNDSINYTFTPIVPQVYSQMITSPCPANYSIYLDSNFPHDSCCFDFGFDVTPCFELRVETSTNRKRRCARNYTYVYYWNQGLILADSVEVHVRLDQYDIPVQVSLPYTIDTSDSSLVFNIGTLQPWQYGTITIIDSIACIPNITGLTQCTKAWILPPNQCLIDSTTDSTWDHSSVSVDAECVNDTCRFVIRNNGSQDMDAPSEYRIYANNVLVYTGSFQLVSGDSLVVLWVSNGATIRLEADQVPGHPGNSHPRETLEGCGDDGSGNFTIGEYNRAPMDDEDVDVEIDCMQIVDSYDPNDKSNSPLGVDVAHIVLPNTPIDYTVRFQNTGTDTAYKVVVIDSLSNDLDLATLELGASSYPYSVSLSGQGRAVLKFTFNNINLVDSTTDELNSHGFVKYKITPKSSVPLGTQINNAADIYFDYNFPVRTNTAYVTLGNYLVLSSGGSKMTKAGSLIFYPNPTSGDITIESAPDNLLQRVDVYSHDGRLIKSLVIGHSSLVNVDMTELSAGVYFLDCKTESGSEKVKVVKY
jgi:uncharacterized repeat protein (TIGR01451 family)